MPAFLVSPWLRQVRLVDSLDHTALLAWLAGHFPRVPGQADATLGLSGYHAADPFAGAWAAGARPAPPAAPDPWTGFRPDIERSGPVALARHFAEVGDPDRFKGEIPEGGNDLQGDIAETLEGKPVVRDPETA